MTMRPLPVMTVTTKKEDYLKNSLIDVKNKSRKKRTNSLIKEARQLFDEIQHEERSSREKFGSGKKQRKRRPSKEDELDQKILCSLIGHQRKRKTKNP